MDQANDRIRISDVFNFMRTVYEDVKILNDERFKQTKAIYQRAIQEEKDHACLTLEKRLEEEEKSKVLPLLPCSCVTLTNANLI